MSDVRNAPECMKQFISELATADGTIFVKFLPANTTSVLQPMDQGVCEQLKCSYQRLLLENMIHLVALVNWTMPR